MGSVGSGLNNFNTTLSVKQARKIERAAWGEDAIPTVLSAISNKLDGFDSYGTSFDVSYQGTRAQLVNEMINVYEAAGIIVRIENRDIVYDNGDTEVHVRVRKEDDNDYTFTDKSHHYGISVNNLYR